MRAPGYRTATIQDVATVVLAAGGVSVAILGHRSDWDGLALVLGLGIVAICVFVVAWGAIHESSAEAPTLTSSVFNGTLTNSTVEDIDTDADVVFHGRTRHTVVRRVRQRAGGR